MTVDRRTALKAMAGVGAAAAAGSAVSLEAREKRVAPPDALGMLYDATRCIGCKACVVACKDANNMPTDWDPQRLYDYPTDLNGKTKNIIKLYKDGETLSYVKRQCMHCIDPGCVGACMIGALQKRDHGVVTWDGDRCIGCRYCQIACPFEIPKFEWDKAVPKIVKCELCKDRKDKAFNPACCEVCPRQAVVFGKYADLLEDAKRRLADHPELYEPKIFGERDGGGTQVLYLSKAGVPFEALGLPNLGEKPIPETAQKIQHGVYQGFITPAVLYVILGAVIWRNKKGQAAGEGKP
jgi:Fe-S-cluster-containing dehydrogenase component